MSKLSTVFCGGCEDSQHPSKVHILNEATGKPLCGQWFARIDRVDGDEISAAEFFGRDACKKCVAKLPNASFTGKTSHE